MGSERPLFEENISLNAYPAEYIFSEKVEAILYLGELNSRMKDFYDCYRLIKEKALDKTLLTAAIHETLENRGTTLEFIPEPNDVFDARWKAFLRKSKISGVTIKEIVTEINKMINEIRQISEP